MMSYPTFSIEDIQKRIDAERLFPDAAIQDAYKRLDMTKVMKPLISKMQARLIFFTTYRGFDLIEQMCKSYGVPRPNDEQLAAFILAQLFVEQIFDDLLSTKR